MAPSIAFGTLLRRHRNAAGLTQEELAARAGMSAHGIADLEAGRRRTPRRETVALLADALGLAEHERLAFEASARQRRSPSPASPHVSAVPAQGAVNSSRGGVALPALVGRDHELAQLERLLAVEGPPLLVLAGEPGIGKSRLLREAATRASALGWEVLEGGCHRRSGQEPFAPLLSALIYHLERRPHAQQRDSLQGCNWLVRLLPELAETHTVVAPVRSLPPEQERRLMFAAVGRYLANVQGPAGTLLVLDDLQWAGDDALDLLGALLRETSHASLRMVAAYRDTEVRTRDSLAMLLADLGREGLAARRALAPLSMTDATSLLDELLHASGAEQAGVRDRIVLRAGGVPYFLLSCAQALDAGVMAEQGQTSDIPWSVAETIRQRVHALGKDAQVLLGAAAVIGREVSHTLLMAVGKRIGADEPAILTSLDEAFRGGLLSETDAHAYIFAHDLVRDLVGGDLTAARRMHLHQAVAEVLEVTENWAPVEQLAYHYSRGGDLQKAVPYVLRAADRAARLFAYAEAIRYYQEAVEMLGTLRRETETAQAREHLALMYLRSAQYDEAIALLNQAIDVYRGQGDNEGVVRAMAPLGLAYAHRGSAKEGLAHLEPLLASSQAADSRAGLPALYLALATLYDAQNREHDALAMFARMGERLYARQAERALAEVVYTLGS